MGGAYAQIYLYDPYVNADQYQPGCGPGPLDCEDSSLAWVAVTNTSALISQDGWKKWYDGTYRYFTEYQDVSGGYHQNIYGIEAVGTTDSFDVLYDNNPGACGQTNCWSFLKNGSIVDIEPADWQPYAAAVASETHTFASQLPGGSTVNEAFTSVQLYTNLHSWQYFPSGISYGVLSQCVGDQTAGTSYCGPNNTSGAFNWVPPGYSTAQYGTNSIWSPSNFYTADLRCGS